MHNRLKPLVSLPFIVCLIVLLVNDFYLKEAYHNTLTGKLSDVCGLFIFPIFWSVLFPKHKPWVFGLTALSFIYWKSELSSGLISVVSAYLFSIQRTIDITDLFTLPVLALAWMSLKQNTKPILNARFLRFVSPYVVAAITVFSFCATSQVRYMQTFEQPQYVLFKAAALPDSSTIDDDYEYYLFDSLLVVKVNQLYITDRPAKNDDYQKNSIIKNLDKDVFQGLPGKKSLIDTGRITTLTIKTPQGNDVVKFNGGRLNGRFVRIQNGKAIIEGVYKMGLEDSVWTFKEAGENKLTKITFVNGERTRVEQFDGNNLTSSSRVNTRADVKRNKIIQIVALALLMIGNIYPLVKNYRQKLPEKPQISLGLRWLVCLMMPFAVWLLQLATTLLLGDVQFDLFFIPVTIFLIYAITCPLYFIIVFGIKLSKEIDILWYSTLFALVCCIWIEFDVLTALSV